MNPVAYRFSLAVVPPAFHLITKLLFWSCRFETEGLEHRRELENSGGHFIAATWHYGVFFALNGMESGKWIAMVSGSRDAEYVARLLQMRGIETVRGSRSQGGALALRQMTRAIRTSERNVAIIADGSKGPARELQGGCILLASLTGYPVLPITFAVDRYFTFRSWDRTILPKPFAKIKLIYGKPTFVPKGLDGPEVEAQRRAVEKQLNDTYSQAWAGFQRLGHAEGG